MRGRKPKPTALKRQQGNPGKRPLNTKEPRPPIGAPTCPQHLKEKARAEWKRVAPTLERLGVLTNLDRAVLAAYCTSYADYVEAVEHLERGKVIIKSPDGGQYQNPWVAVKRRATEQMLKCAGELGLTPSSRGRVQAVDMETPEETEARLFPHGAKRTARK